MASLRWDDRPSSDRLGRLEIPLFRVPAQGKVHVAILGPFRGLWTHYVRGRTLPCVLQGCPHCGEVPARWKGYSPSAVWAEEGKAWKRAVFEVPESLVSFAGDVETVGKIWTFWRAGKKHRLAYEPVAAELQGKIPAIVPFEITPTLERVFDCTDRHLRPFVPEQEEVG